MKIIVAPNALKDSLSATKAAEAIAVGIRRSITDAEIIKIPVADGGDGLLDVLAAPLHAERHTCTVRGPLGTAVKAFFLFCPEQQLALIEMAAASGIALLPPEQRKPMLASTFGTGELIQAAVDLGATRILLGIGGSASTDGGTGLATALGVQFLDKHGTSLPGNGLSLQKINSIDLRGMDQRLKNIRLEIACDVNNPLLGEHGSARIYAAQKGASEEQIEQLECGLENFSDVIKQQLHNDIRNIPGSGAAGGLSVALIAFFDAEIVPGAKHILKLLHFNQTLENADLVITCEGRLDMQTRFAKAPAAVASAAMEKGVPCIAIAGQLGKGAFELEDIGIKAVFSLNPGLLSRQDAIKNAAEHLANTAEQIVRRYLS